MIQPTQKESSIYFFSLNDEMRQPYESQLKNHCDRFVWVSDLGALSKSSAQNAKAVIVDTDAIKTSVTAAIDMISNRFLGATLIALSQSDSSQLALHCMRNGFSDFLLKPVSPEELAWSLKKATQRNDVLKRLESESSSLLRAVTQISGCQSPTLLRLRTTDFLRLVFGAEGAAWVAAPTKGQTSPTILSSSPTGLSAHDFVSHFSGNPFPVTKPISILRKKGKEERKLIMKCQHTETEALFFWGVKNRPSKTQTEKAKLLLEHSELTLLNLFQFQEIRQQTFLDELTGLYNSRYLRFAMQSAVQKAEKESRGFAVLFIDVDHFKSINDQNGHLVGSDFLIAIAKVIRNTVRSVDQVFRYGGDEFVVILQNTILSGAREIAERIRKHVERRVFVLHEKHLQTTVSIGLAAFPDHARTYEELLKMADEAMYSAKRISRNTVQLAVSVSRDSKPTPDLESR